MFLWKEDFNVSGTIILVLLAHLSMHTESVGKKMYTKVTNVHKGLIAPLAIRFSANLFLSVWDKSGDTTVGARFFVYDEARSY